jgi:hypothetical protein
MNSFDVYAYGMVSTSTLYKLDEKYQYPQADNYAEFADWYSMTGGEAANSSIVLGKLGVSISTLSNPTGRYHRGGRYFPGGSRLWSTPKLARRNHGSFCLRPGGLCMRDFSGRN